MLTAVLMLSAETNGSLAWAVLFSFVSSLTSSRRQSHSADRLLPEYCQVQFTLYYTVLKAKS